MTGAFENNHNAMTMGVQEGGRVDDTGTPRGTTLDATPQAAVEPETLAVSSKRVRSLVRDNPTGPQEGVGYTGLSPKSPRSGRHGSKATTPGAVAVDGRILSVDQDSPGSIVGASGLSPKSVRKSRHGSKATTPGAVAVGNGDLVEANASKHLATAVTVTNTATLRQDSPSTVTTPGAVAVQGAADDSNMEESETTPGAVHETGGNPEHPKKLRSRLSRGPADEETTPGAVHETGGSPEHPKKLRNRLSRGPADEEATPGAEQLTGSHVIIEQTMAITTKAMPIMVGMWRTRSLAVLNSTTTGNMTARRTRNREDQSMEEPWCLFRCHPSLRLKW